MSQFKKLQNTQVIDLAPIKASRGDTATEYAWMYSRKTMQKVGFELRLEEF